MKRIIGGLILMGLSLLWVKSLFPKESEETKKAISKSKKIMEILDSIRSGETKKLNTIIGSKVLPETEKEFMEIYLHEDERAIDQVMRQLKLSREISNYERKGRK